MSPNLIWFCGHCLVDGGSGPYSWDLDLHCPNCHRERASFISPKSASPATSRSPLKTTRSRRRSHSPPALEYDVKLSQRTTQLSQDAAVAVEATQRSPTSRLISRHQIVEQEGSSVNTSLECLNEYSDTKARIDSLSSLRIETISKRSLLEDFLNNSDNPWEQESVARNVRRRIPGQFSFSLETLEPATTSPRKPYDAVKRAETASTRRRGSCRKCKKQKVRCNNSHRLGELEISNEDHEVTLGTALHKNSQQATTAESANAAINNGAGRHYREEPSLTSNTPSEVTSLDTPSLVEEGFTVSSRSCVQSAAAMDLSNINSQKLQLTRNLPDDDAEPETRGTPPQDAADHTKLSEKLLSEDTRPQRCANDDMSIQLDESLEGVLAGYLDALDKAQTERIGTPQFEDMRSLGPPELDPRLGPQQQTTGNAFMGRFDAMDSSVEDRSTWQPDALPTHTLTNHFNEPVELHNNFLMYSSPIQMHDGLHPVPGISSYPQGDHVPQSSIPNALQLGPVWPDDDDTAAACYGRAPVYR